MKPRLVLNSWSFCISFPSAGTTGPSHNVLLVIMFLTGTKTWGSFQTCFTLENLKRIQNNQNAWMTFVLPSWNCHFSSIKTPHFPSSASLFFEVKYTYFGSHRSKLSWTTQANCCGPYWNLNMNYALPFINKCLVFNWWNCSRNFRKWPAKRNHATGDRDFKVLSWPSVAYSQPLYPCPLRDDKAPLP